MPIRLILIENDTFYHVYNRGFLKAPIFKNNKDCHKFISLIKKYQKRHEVIIKSFALMENHIHFLLMQHKEDSIRKFMQYLQMAFALYFNNKYRREGPLFGTRYKAKPVLEDDYYIEIKKYIANNPIEKVLKLTSKENSLINSSTQTLGSGANLPFY